MNNTVIQIAKEFRKNGFELFEVGGHVRDSLLGKKSDDIDLTTDALPVESRRIIEDMDIGSIYDIGILYGTIGIALKNGEKIEITTYRGEVYPTDSRKPNVVFGNEIFEDLYRRDFTINAIARNPLTGETFDPFNGIIDIKDKIVRVVGSNARFDEDPLRMMRAIRFAVQLNFKLQIEISHPERLTIISEERKRDELIKILNSNDPRRGIELLVLYGLMKYIIPEFLELKDVSQGKFHIKDAYEHTLMVLEKIAGEDGDKLILRLAALLHDIGKPEAKTIDDDNVHFYSHQDIGAVKAVEILTRLRFENSTIEKIEKLIKMHMYPILLEMSLNLRTIMRLVRKTGEDDIFLLLALMKSDLASTRKPRYAFILELTGLVREAIEYKPTEIESPINGSEIMTKFNIPPSRLVGEIKQLLIEQVIDGTLERSDKDSAFETAMKYLQGRAENVSG